MGTHRWLKGIVGLVGVVSLSTAHAAGTSQRLDVTTATPIELGTRYGQAVGIALVCYGVVAKSDAVESLKLRFKGADRKAFDRQAGKILAAWKRTLTCEKSGGPNECRLSHIWSCREGLKELGPEGSVIPGLVEQKKK